MASLDNYEDKGWSRNQLRKLASDCGIANARQLSSKAECFAVLRQHEQASMHRQQNQASIQRSYIATPQSTRAQPVPERQESSTRLTANNDRHDIFQEPPTSETHTEAPFTDVYNTMTSAELRALYAQRRLYGWTMRDDDVIMALRADDAANWQCNLGTAFESEDEPPAAVVKSAKEALPAEPAAFSDASTSRSVNTVAAIASANLNQAGNENGAREDSKQNTRTKRGL